MPVAKARGLPAIAGIDKKYQAESDMRTLVEAKKIEADPARHKAAKAEATRQHAALKSVAGGKANG